MRTQFCAGAFENRLFRGRLPETYPFLRRTQFCEPLLEIAFRRKRTRFCVPAATTFSAFRTRFCVRPAGALAGKIFLFPLYTSLVPKASACTQKEQIGKRVLPGVPVSAHAAEGARADAGFCCERLSDMRTRFCGGNQAGKGPVRTRFCGKMTISLPGQGNRGGKRRGMGQRDCLEGQAGARKRDLSAWAYPILRNFRCSSCRGGEKKKTAAYPFLRCDIASVDPLRDAFGDAALRTGADAQRNFTPRVPVSAWLVAAWLQERRLRVVKSRSPGGGVPVSAALWPARKPA